jgi:hypothetical protein
MYIGFAGVLGVLDMEKQMLNAFDYNVAFSSIVEANLGSTIELYNCLW